jgi:enamine deaminase RidA (YjgF/YER057c/UK114 family)
MVETMERSRPLPPSCGMLYSAVVDRPHVELIRSPELAASAPYAYAAIARDCSRLVFTAGACPLDEGGETVAVGDVAGQAEQVMVNLRLALRAAGAELEDVLKTTVYVASQDQEDLVTAWNIVRTHFADHDVPSTLLGVCALGYRHQLVEVEAVAALP